MKFIAACRVAAGTLLALASFASWSALASTPGVLSTSTLTAHFGLLNVRVGVQSPAEGNPIGDILFVHGFADRLDNHGPLFDEWNRAGFRVIAFDLPSHGLDSGIANVIDKYDFNALSNLALQVERSTREQAERPLFLAGWSTGGLIVTRMAQTDALSDSGRSLSGLILFAPAVSVPALVGDHGFVTLATLTNNPSPPHFGSITPASPLLHPIFAANLVANALLSRHEALPSGVPTLTIVAGDTEDLYVKTPDLKAWVASQRSDYGASVTAFQCAGAKHELDNEPAPVGDQVRALAAAFAASVVTGAPIAGASAPCASF